MTSLGGRFRYEKEALCGGDYCGAGEGDPFLRLKITVYMRDSRMPKHSFGHVRRTHKQISRCVWQQPFRLDGFTIGGVTSVAVCCERLSASFPCCAQLAVGEKLCDVVGYALRLPRRVKPWQKGSY